MIKRHYSTSSTDLSPYYQYLAQIVAQFAQNDGKTASPIPALSFYRHNRPEYALPCLYPMGLVVAVQGKKQVRCGSQTQDYDVGEVLFVGADLSAYSYVPECNSENPYLSLLIEWDMPFLAQLVASLPPLSVSSALPSNPLHVLPADEALLDAIVRLCDTWREPDLCAHLAPLIQQEIALRVLCHPQGVAIRQMLAQHSPMPSISRVAAWIRHHVAEKTSLAELADMANMSESSFRQHFRRIIGVSPLQYQKQLRLQQARQLLLNENKSVAQVALAVGYESVSQFSREYHRFFGVTAMADKGHAQ